MGVSSRRALDEAGDFDQRFKGLTKEGFVFAFPGFVRGFRTRVSGSKVSGLRSRVSGLGFRVRGSVVWVWGFERFGFEGFGVWGLEVCDQAKAPGKVRVEDDADARRMHL